MFGALAGHDDLLMTGWGHTSFGKSAAGLADLIAQAAGDAMEHAGVDPQDIDEVWLGNFNAGLQDFMSPASLVVDAIPELWGVPVTHVENACASGSSALQAGVRGVASGMARQVLVVGVEKMTDAGAERVGEALLAADLNAAGKSSSVGFAGLFARVADAYAERYGCPLDAMASIAHKNHQNGLRNPLAHLQKDFTHEFCRQESPANPVVSGLLKRTDCSPISDGAAAVVLSQRVARSSQASTTGVQVVGSGQANDHADGSRRDPLSFGAAGLAWRRAMERAGVGVGDLSLVELHDCFTIAELVLYEVLGLAEPGLGGAQVGSGRFDREGALPVNPSGGLKSKGHPVGATGVSQAVMAAMQLTGTAGGCQVPGAKLAAVQNMGGLGLANNVMVLAAEE